MRAAPDLSTAEWYRSSYSNADGGNCVEVAVTVAAGADRPTTVLIRDSKNPSGAVLPVRRASWQRFLAGLAAS